MLVFFPIFAPFLICSVAGFVPFWGVTFAVPFHNASGFYPISISGHCVYFIACIAYVVVEFVLEHFLYENVNVCFADMANPPVCHLLAPLLVVLFVWVELLLGFLGGVGFPGLRLVVLCDP